MDIIDMKSYDAGYTSGLVEGIGNGYEIGYNLCLRKVKNELKEVKKRRLYFLKQRLAGIFLLIFTFSCIIALDGDATIALVTVPLSILLMFTKEKLFVWREN